MEIATREGHLSRVVWTSASSPTNKNRGYEAFPPDLFQLRSTLPVGPPFSLFFFFFKSQSTYIYEMGVE